MGFKKVALLIFGCCLLWANAWGVSYEDLPELVEKSPILTPYGYHLEQIDARIRRLSLENGWWLSLSGTYYFNDSYAEDVIGYTFGLSLKLTKSFGGYTANNLFQRFLARLDYLRVNLSREERRLLLLWRARFLYVEHLLLEKKAEVLAALTAEAEKQLTPLRERMTAGFARREDLDWYADRLFRYQLEESLCRDQQRKIRELLALLLGLKEMELDQRPLYVSLPIDLPARPASGFLEAASEELSRLSRKRFYPRFKFFLGADRTWDDNSGGFWTGFSVSIPLHFRAAERAREEEIFALWQRLKEEEATFETRLKNEAFEHLLGLLSSRGDLRFLARRVSRLLLERSALRAEPFDPGRVKVRIEVLETLKDYYDTQLRLFGLLASLGSALRLEELPGKGPGVLFALPPREVAAWWWRNQASPLPVEKALEEWGIRRIYFSLNASQIQRYLVEGDPGLSRFILDLYRRGVSVEILLGEPRWIFPREREKLLKILSLLEKRLYPLVQTVHLDIEPHALKDFARRKAHYLRLYLDTLEELSSRTPFALVVDVPLYFLREKVTWHGKEALIVDHLLSFVSGVVVMNYLGDPALFEKKAREVARLLDEREVPYWIGLSVEKEISEEESLKGLSPEALKQLLIEDLESLSSSWFFRGLAVETFEDLTGYAPSATTP